ncbi:MAG: translational GTPase TypA [Pseudobdellovibrionaceae bacterium]|nr:translational GTPase TypA [Bdellovibrionales bacterium]USN47958.1 MAG: translational GTPase TypA [Pseudobdellovibrionaceae bacterium]
MTHTPSDILNFRNIAIIAHVDHGKTTLVDHLLRQAGTFQAHQEVEDRLMDSMDLERERGITIAAKNASFMYNNIKVNIVDTPGHSDFGGEVERILDMVDGAILLVDASEGPLPQTRFVLGKALKQNLKVIVCINKIDRSDARVNEVLDEIFDLFIDLDATEEQCDFDVVYTVAREGWATKNHEVKGENLKPLYDLIIDKVPPPESNPDGPLQILVANIDYNNFVGRLAVGRIRSGHISVGDEVLVVTEDAPKKIKVSALFVFSGKDQKPVKTAVAGDIVVVAGFDEINIGDTITSIDKPAPLPRIAVEEPTVGVIVSVNDGPFSGRDGKQVTSRKIKDRLDQELLRNVAIRVEPGNSPESFKLFGRGELQLAILLEQMRREGFEVTVSKPQVILKKEDGKTLEPMELAIIDVPEEFVGVVTEKLGTRKGVMTNMSNKGSGRARVEIKIPARGLIGYRSEFLTDTRGTGLLNTQFAGFEEYRGDLKTRHTGAIVADRQGKATAYALDTLGDRGRLFITPGAEVYQGMVVGEANKSFELNVNVTKEKKLTNMRASGSDDNIKLAPVKPMTLEQALEWITEDELVEITPSHIRVRCRELDPNRRKTK